MNTSTQTLRTWTISLFTAVSKAGVGCLKLIVRCYQLGISPFVQPRCRYQPTCSHYAMEALETHGWISGTTLTVKRLLKCHPWADGGVDLVPQPKTDGSKS